MRVREVKRMAVLELTCPHCGANIEVNEDAISFDCPRCGSRIILQASENTGFSRNIPMNRFENDLESMVTKKKSPIRSLVSTLICVTVVACVGLTGYEWHCDREMKATRQEIESLIVSGDYLKARGKLVGFEYQGLLSSNRKSWNDQKVHIAVFPGQQGHNSRPVRAIIGGQQAA